MTATITRQCGSIIRSRSERRRRAGDAVTRYPDDHLIWFRLARGRQTRWRDQDAANRELRRTLQASAVRATELVIVFTAATAFAVGSLQITLTGTLPLGDRAILLAVLGGGLLLFAIVILAGTWIITGRERRAPDNPRQPE